MESMKVVPSSSGATAGTATPPVLLVPAATPQGGEVGALLRRLRRDGLIALAVWGLGFGLWAGFAPISGAVVGSGFVKVEANRLTVSHRDGGIVAQVPVHEGQIVRRGQTLVVLEDARLDSSVDLLAAQLAVEQLRRSRLEAEAALRPNWMPPPELGLAGTAGSTGVPEAANRSGRPDAAGAGPRAGGRGVEASSGSGVASAAPAGAADAGVAAAESVAATVAGVAAATRLREALARERSAFDARRRTLQGQLESIRSQMQDAETEMKAHERDATAATEALRLMRDELASNERLLEENFVNRTRVLSLRRGVAEYESRIEASRAEQAQARQKRTELEGRLATVRDAYVQQATEDLREAAARIVDFEERLRANRDSARRQVVTAPTDGRLVDLKVNTVGSALGPLEPIVDIVPSDVPLVVEARVSAQSVSDIAPGQAAEVKLLAYSQRSSGMLDARVVRVSADALVDERSGLHYFAVQVEVAAEALQRAAHGPLLPGMAAEVYIKTHERTALEFLLDPLAQAMRRSFREH
jgi:HlyD family type I secretion membrane fusion protein